MRADRKDVHRLTNYTKKCGFTACNQGDKVVTRLTRCNQGDKA